MVVVVVVVMPVLVRMAWWMELVRLYRGWEVVGGVVCWVWYAHCSLSDSVRLILVELFRMVFRGVRLC